MEEVVIEIVVLPHAMGLELPVYQTSDSAGMDLRNADTEFTLLLPGERHAFPCGFKMAIPKGYEAQIRPRSGLAVKEGLTVVNAPGTIDSDYRGEVLVALINHSREVKKIRRGDRIAQMIIAPVVRGKLQVVETLTETERGTGGLGSTGVK